MRIMYEELLRRFKEILMSRGLAEDYAEEAAAVFAGNSRDGIYSHGANRFPRIIGDIDRGGHRSFGLPPPVRWPQGLWSAGTATGDLAP